MKITIKKNKYIVLKVVKRYEGKNYINRFIHLLNLLAPGKYRFDTINMLASIEENENGLTVLTFSDNPF